MVDWSCFYPTHPAILILREQRDTLAILAMLAGCFNAFCPVQDTLITLGWGGCNILYFNAPSRVSAAKFD